MRRHSFLMIDQKENSKSKIRLCIMAVLCIIAIITSIVGYRFMTRDPYQKYVMVSDDHKHIGTAKHELQDEDTYYLSLYYPQFGIEKLDQAIETYLKTQIHTDLKQNSKVIISVDYDSYDLYDAYISIAFHQTLMNEQGKELNVTTSTINYDKKLDKLMTHEDVLRNDYLPLLKTMAKNQHLDASAITKDALNTFLLGDTDVTFYFDQDSTRSLSIPYAQHKNYIALTNPNIPSLYQKDAIIPVIKDKDIDPKKPMIAFTFDDGPSDLTEKLLDAFDQYDASATFFMVGPRVKQHPEVVAQIYQRGFELGNHTWSHEVELTKLSEKQLDKEIYDTQDAIFEACGHDATYLRAPYGSYDEQVLKASTMPLAYWGIDSEDWRSRNVKAIKKEIMNNLFDGAIILEHDIYDTSVEAAIELLPEIKAQGYQIVSLSTLMKYRGDMLTKSNFIIPSLYE